MKSSTAHTQLNPARLSTILNCGPQNLIPNSTGHSKMHSDSFEQDVNSIELSDALQDPLS